MSLVYCAISYLVFGLALPFFLFSKKLRQGQRRRFGLYTRKPWPNPESKAPKIWFHGASAGGLIALIPTIEMVREARPEVSIVVSTMTNSGFEIARSKLSKQIDGITFLPYDFYG